MEGEETRMKEGNKAVRKYMKYWSMNRLRSRKEGDVGTRGCFEQSNRHCSTFSLRQRANVL